MNVFMNLKNISYGPYRRPFPMKIGVVLSALVILTFLLDLPQVMSLTSKSLSSTPCNSNMQCDMDDSEEDGQDAPILVSFTKKYALSPAFNFPAERSHVVAHSNQPPPDFPPESI